MKLYTINHARNVINSVVPFCYYSEEGSYYVIKNCCIKGRIRHLFLYDAYTFISPKNGYPIYDKPDVYNYIPFTAMCKLVACLSAVLFWNLYIHRSGKRVINNESNLQSNYCIFLIVLILNLCFGFFISIPYSLIHYILLAVLGVISIFNKKPLYGYYGIMDRGMVK